MSFQILDGAVQAKPTQRINSRLIAPSTSSDITTTPVTRAPARSTSRASTPSPSAAIDMMVNMLDEACAGCSAQPGTRPKERSAISSKKPTINHGSTCASAGRDPPSLRPNSDSSSTTGPSISTRTSLTSVPMCTLVSDTTLVAASTCGTAYTVKPAKIPYCTADSDSSGASSGKPSTTSTPSTAVKPITAAMAELPQIELPQAISTAILLGKPIKRPMA